MPRRGASTSCLRAWSMIAGSGLRPFGLALKDPPAAPDNGMTAAACPVSSLDAAGRRSELCARERTPTGIPNICRCQVGQASDAPPAGLPHRLPSTEERMSPDGIPGPAGPGGPRALGPPAFDLPLRTFPSLQIEDAAMPPPGDRCGASALCSGSATMHAQRRGADFLPRHLPRDDHSCSEEDSLADSLGLRTTSTSTCNC